MEERRLHVVDSYALAFRSFYAFARNPLVNSKGESTGLVFGYLNALLRLVLEQKATHVAIATDLPGPTFRTELYPLYKANRGEMPEEMRVQMPMFEELQSICGLPVLSREGMEADDVIAALAREAREAGWKCSVLSKDKDLMQLVDDDVVLMQLERAGAPPSICGPEEVRAKWGVGPELMRDLQALVGDAIDNVPGVPGVGPKTAAALLLKWGSLDALLEHLDEAGTPKVRQNLLASRENIAIARELVSLRSDFSVGFLPERFDVRAHLKTDALLDFCDRHELHSAARGLKKLAAEWKAARDTVTVPEGEPAAVREAPAVAALSAREGGERKLFAEAFAKATGVAAVLRAEDPAARTAVPDALLLSDGERVWEIPAPEAPGLLEECGDVLFRDGLPWIFHDAKAALRLMENASLPRPRLFEDTMLASWCLDAGERVHSLEEQAARRLSLDLDPADFPARALATAALWPALRGELEREGLLENYCAVELPTVEVLRKMESRGIRVDVGALGALSDEMAARIDETRARIWNLAGVEFNVASPKQLGEVLFGTLGLPHGKKTRTGEYSTGAAVLEELRWDWPIVEEVLRYRELTKLKGTYVDVLPTLLDSEGRVHTTFNQTVAATGRLSSTDPNLQNIPVRSELGARIRAAFVARDDRHVLVCADWSQIELRVLAHLSGDPELRAAYREGADIHRRTAAILQGMPEGLVSDADRRRAKAINFGVIYGMSAFRLAKEQKIPLSAAKEFVDGYFENFSRVRAFSEEIVRAARRDGYVTTLFGHRRAIPELNAENRNLQAQGERMAVNSVIQGTAADLMKLAMVRVDRAIAESGIDAKMLLQVHDELVLETPRESAGELSALLKREMENVAELSVPLVADVGVGDNWKEAH